MRKGMILYVTQGKDDVPQQGETELTELIDLCRSLDVAAVCVATTEEDVHYGWWQLITKGVHQVLLMAAAYDATLESFAFDRSPVRLWGLGCEACGRLGHPDLEICETGRIQTTAPFVYGAA